MKKLIILFAIVSLTSISVNAGSVKQNCPKENKSIVNLKLGDKSIETTSVKLDNKGQTKTKTQK